jgi:predicted cupin superfamily sugar epimerase
MIDHPEGGRYNEVYRSAAKVIKSDGKSRSALTHIYFSLKPGEISRFHRVECDEVWNLYEGEGLILYLWDEIFNSIEKVELSKSTREYCHVVPAGIWQAATVKDEEVLVGCSVGPGFEFEDFRLMNIEERAAISLLGHFPDLKDLIKS